MDGCLLSAANGSGNPPLYHRTWWIDLLGFGLTFRKKYGMISISKIRKGKIQKKAVTDMNENLWKLLEEAKQNEQLRQQLWQTKEEKDPALALCQLATARGYAVTVGELFAEGEEYTSNLLKSCNGGASYPLEGWEDSYDLFFASLAAMQ